MRSVARLDAAELLEFALWLEEVWVGRAWGRLTEAELLDLDSLTVDTVAILSRGLLPEF